MPELSPAAVPPGITKPGWVGEVVTCHLLVEAPDPEGSASYWPFLSVALGQTAVGRQPFGKTYQYEKGGIGEREC